MRDPTLAVRAIIIYAVLVPLAIFVGYMVATPTDRSTFVVFGLILAVVTIPLLLRWHYPLLLLSWNMAAVIFFLPGRPELWLLMALASFLITVVQRALDPEVEMNPAPSVLRPLLFLLAVVLITAQFTGGIHVGSLGSATLGGRRYAYIICGVLGFIAITSQRIPEDRANLYLGLFLLGEMTKISGDLVAVIGPAFKYILVIFPTYSQHTLLALRGEAGGAPGQEYMVRAGGTCFAATALFYYIVARYGIQNLLNGRNGGKLILALFLLAVTAVGGFRSYLLNILMTCFLLFWLEGLLRTRYFFICSLALVLSASFMILFAKKMPLSVQRTLSILPVEVDPVVRANAEGSSEWRVRMWKEVLPYVPRYLWLGKGLAIDAAAYETEERFRTEEARIMAGDYHNGPLSVIIPFGIWGMIGWVWFLAAGGRAVYLNYRYGDPSLRTINRFFLAYFSSSAISFFFVFGGFYSQVSVFAGVVAFNIGLNGGVRRPVAVPALSPEPVAREFKHRHRGLAPGLLP